MQKKAFQVIVSTLFYNFVLGSSKVEDVVGESCCGEIEDVEYDLIHIISEEDDDVDVYFKDDVESDVVDSIPSFEKSSFCSESSVTISSSEESGSVDAAEIKPVDEVKVIRGKHSFGLKHIYEKIESKGSTSVITTTTTGAGVVNNGGKIYDENKSLRRKLSNLLRNRSSRKSQGFYDNSKFDSNNSISQPSRKSLRGSFSKLKRDHISFHKSSLKDSLRWCKGYRSIPAVSIRSDLELEELDSNYGSLISDSSKASVISVITHGSILFDEPELEFSSVRTLNAGVIIPKNYVASGISDNTLSLVKKLTPVSKIYAVYYPFNITPSYMVCHKFKSMNLLNNLDSRLFFIPTLTSSFGPITLISGSSAELVRKVKLPSLMGSSAIVKSIGPCVSVSSAVVPQGFIIWFKLELNFKLEKVKSILKRFFGKFKLVSGTGSGFVGNTVVAPQSYLISGKFELSFVKNHFGSSIASATLIGPVKLTSIYKDISGSVVSSYTYKAPLVTNKLGLSFCYNHLDYCMAKVTSYESVKLTFSSRLIESLKYDSDIVGYFTVVPLVTIIHGLGLSFENNNLHSDNAFSLVQCDTFIKSGIYAVHYTTFIGPRSIRSYELELMKFIGHIDFDIYYPPTNYGFGRAVSWGSDDSDDSNESESCFQTDVSGCSIRDEFAGSDDEFDDATDNIISAVSEKHFVLTLDDEFLDDEKDYDNSSDNDASFCCGKSAGKKDFSVGIESNLYFDSNYDDEGNSFVKPRKYQELINYYGSEEYQNYLRDLLGESKENEGYKLWPYWNADRELIVIPYSENPNCFNDTITSPPSDTYRADSANEDIKHLYNYQGTFLDKWWLPLKRKPDYVKSKLSLCYPHPTRASNDDSCFRNGSYYSNDDYDDYDDFDVEDYDYKEPNNMSTYDSEKLKNLEEGTYNDNHEFVVEAETSYEETIISYPVETESSEVIFDRDYFDNLVVDDWCD
ncbi:hypothetical protein DFJ63DRAFT_320426 [Scheffersomyces coipomensis]|uniref:uncharacterized protein n=1 Tax=Scheffersomyces coipomensis TaxID=1788519 RepID=UPI00315D7629